MTRAWNAALPGQGTPQAKLEGQQSVQPRPRRSRHEEAEYSTEPAGIGPLNMARPYTAATEQGALSPLRRVDPGHWLSRHRRQKVVPHRHTTPVVPPATSRPRGEQLDGSPAGRGVRGGSKERGRSGHAEFRKAQWDRAIVTR